MPTPTRGDIGGLDWNPQQRAGLYLDPPMHAHVPLHAMRHNRRKGFWLKPHTDEADAYFALTVALASFVAGCTEAVEVHS